MKTAIEQIVSVLTEEQQQLLKDTIRFGRFGDCEVNFLNNGDITEEWAYGYCTNCAKEGGHFTGRKISAMFRSIYKKMCPALYNQAGEYLSHCSDWWGDGSGDMLFIRDAYVEEFEKWARA